MTPDVYLDIHKGMKIAGNMFKYKKFIFSHFKLFKNDDSLQQF